MVLLLLNLDVSAPLQGSPSAVSSRWYTPKQAATMKIQQKPHLNLLSSNAIIQASLQPSQAEFTGYFWLGQLKLDLFSAEPED